MLLTESQTSDHTGAAMLDALPAASDLIGDRSYDSDGYRAAFEDKGITPCIPPRKKRRVQHAYDATLYRQCHSVENMFAKLPDWRCIATRYDRCADIFMAAIKLAATIIFWLKECVLNLGSVDGFNQDEGAGEVCDVEEALCGLFASERDTLEALELAHGLLDARPGLVEQFGEEAGPVTTVGAGRNDWGDAARAGGSAVLLADIAFVGDGGARRDVGADVERGFELGAVAHLAAGQMDGDGAAVEVGLEMDFARKPASRPAERLALLPPFAPAAETWARTTVLSNI